MSFNYASEKRKFDAMWAKLRVEYREAGMEESAIAAMYEFDCEVFRKNRTYGIHNTYFSTVMPDGEEVIDDRSSFYEEVFFQIQRTGRRIRSGPEIRMDR